MISYHRSAVRPSLRLWVEDDDGDLIDFSTGYTFLVEIGPNGGAALLSKTTGITGAAGAGTAPDGTPNVVIEWAAGELNLAPRQYTLELTATTGGLPRKFSEPFTIKHTVGS